MNLQVLILMLHMCVCACAQALNLGSPGVSQSSASSCTSTSRPSSCTMCLSKLLSSHIADSVVRGLSDFVFFQIQIPVKVSFQDCL